MNSVHVKFDPTPEGITQCTVVWATATMHWSDTNVRNCISPVASTKVESEEQTGAETVRFKSK